MGSREGRGATTCILKSVLPRPKGYCCAEQPCGHVWQRPMALNTVELLRPHSEKMKKVAEALSNGADAASREAEIQSRAVVVA